MGSICLKGFDLRVLKHQIVSRSVLKIDPAVPKLLFAGIMRDCVNLWARLPLLRLFTCMSQNIPINKELCPVTGQRMQGHTNQPCVESQGVLTGWLCHNQTQQQSLFTTALSLFTALRKAHNSSPETFFGRFAFIKGRELSMLATYLNQRPIMWRFVWDFVVSNVQCSCLKDALKS